MTTTEGIWSRLAGSRLISFMMFATLTGTSFLTKSNDSSSVAVRPKSTSWRRVTGEGL